VEKSEVKIPLGRWEKNIEMEINGRAWTGIILLGIGKLGWML
jgi:hypothetical protein